VVYKDGRERVITGTVTKAVGNGHKPENMAGTLA
jgi:hypothetical protein